MGSAYPQGIEEPPARVVYEGMAALLVRQPCFAGHICHPVSAGHGPDRTYLVVPMVSHGGLRSVRGVDGRPAMSAPQQRGKEKQDKKPEFDYAVWDAVVSELQVRYSSYASISLTAGKAQVNKPGNMRSSDTAAFDARTGEITSVTAYDDIPRAQKMKGWFYAFHTGSWGGMTTKALYFLAAFIGGILPLSGYYLWLKKKRRPSRKKGAVTCLLTGRRPLSSKDSFRRSNSEAGSLFPSKAEWQKLGFVF